MTSCWNLLTDEQQTEAKELMKTKPMERKRMMNQDGKGRGNGQHRMMDNDNDDAQEEHNE
jgi:hypothetical protein